MKIGEFSRLHHVSIDTVRFYVNEGLLVPIKDGYHYQFDQQCSTDFLNIMLLKEVGFSPSLTLYYDENPRNR
ncbi:MAG: MerR family transcriptional regulator [Lachnospiraceae bacterium]|nr:MerR family transcriptional regulator [Lachnospiraceae bacterium]